MPGGVAWCWLCIRKSVCVVTYVCMCISFVVHVVRCACVCHNMVVGVVRRRSPSPAQSQSPSPSPSQSLLILHASCPLSCLSSLLLRLSLQCLPLRAWLYICNSAWCKCLLLQCYINVCLLCVLLLIYVARVPICCIRSTYLPTYPRKGPLL